MKILICGVTGSGKTTLALALAPLINAVVFDGDYVRKHFTPHLGFTPAERIAQAETMSKLCEPVVTAGGNVIASFCCPTDDTRAAFGADFVIAMERDGDHQHPDTDAMYDPPLTVDVLINDNSSPAYWADYIARRIQPVFEPLKPTALFVGRYQPFHDGHKKLIETGIAKYGQVCIGVRSTDSAWPFEKVRARIDAAMAVHRGKYIILPLPNINAVCYGRRVGYKIDQIFLDDATHDISATKIRADMALKAATR